MAKGGARPGAGRKPDPNSARQKALAARVTKAAQGFTEPDGARSKDAPPGWVFGTVPPEVVRPPVKPPAPHAGPEDVLMAVTLLQQVYRDPGMDLKVRLQAAQIAAPFESPKLAPVTKKEPKPEKAAAPSRFAQKAPPKLVVNNKG